MKLGISLFLLILCFGSLFSQELEPTVDVNMDKISIDVRDRLTDFKQDVYDYLSKTKFTDEVIVNEIRGKPYKIKCNFQIFFTNVTGFDSYEAQVFVGVQRYVYKSPNFTPLIKLIDEKWEFNYSRGQSLIHDNLRFNNLTSFLDYYAYMIIGYDDDSWELELGDKRFQLAQDVVNLAVALSSTKGWTDNSLLKPSRSSYPQELLNSQYDDFRKGFWIYHFAGIDSLQYNKRQALERIAEAISLIAKTKKSEFRSFNIKLFFDTKYMEIAQLMVDYYDKTIYRKLSELDPDHIATYDEYSKK